jgi:SAM-dependent methyltransferase
MERGQLLLLGCRELLPELLQRFPEAELFLSEPSLAAVPQEWRCLPRVHWLECDYLMKPLPYRSESFDYILVDGVLEQVENVPDFTLAMYFWLKQDGHLLTAVWNVRFWRVMRDLLRGHFSSERRRFFSLSSLQRLFFSTFYREVFYEAELEKPSADFMEKMVAAGSVHAEEELAVSRWLVKASRSTKAMVFLKQQLTPELRQQLVYLVRRIAYDIEREESCAAFWRFYEEQQLTSVYALRFIESTAQEPERVLLALLAAGGQRLAARQLLEESMRE